MLRSYTSQGCAQPKGPHAHLGLLLFALEPFNLILINCLNKMARGKVGRAGLIHMQQLSASHSPQLGVRAGHPWVVAVVGASSRQPFLPCFDSMRSTFFFLTQQGPSVLFILPLLVICPEGSDSWAAGIATVLKVSRITC
jgi:hypothetical protein